MFPIIGILIVFGAVVAGYLMEHGKLLVLAQPAELIIIFGAAVGTVVTANPLPTLIRLGKAMAGVLSASPYTKAFYSENIKMLYELFSMARKAGTAKLEEDIDNPAKSDVLKKYPKFLASHHALDFLGDTLRMAVSGVVDPMDIDTMMEVDLESHHREARDDKSEQTGRQPPPIIAADKIKSKQDNAHSDQHAAEKPKRRVFGRNTFPNRPPKSAKENGAKHLTRHQGER